MQTHAEALYVAGCIVTTLEKRKFAPHGGFGQSVLLNLSRVPESLAMHLRFPLIRAKDDPDIVGLVADFDPPSGPATTVDQCSFWMGYYHQKVALFLPGTFQERVAKAIGEGGFASTAAFAQSSGIPPQTLSNLLSGQRKPRWDTVQKIAAALGISTDSLRDPAP